MCSNLCLAFLACSFPLHLWQIEDRKLDWAAESKVGSLDNVKHKPGGGDKKVTTVTIVAPGVVKIKCISSVCFIVVHVLAKWGCIHKRG